MYSNSISATTGIPNVGEKWFKKVNLDLRYYERYLKPRYKNDKKSIFPFSHLLDRYVPMMKIIMKYFTCEGMFSRLYSCHIRLLMHTTRVIMLHIPYYLSQRIDKMAYILPRRHYNHQMKIFFHLSVIKMVVMHQLKQKKISSDRFI